jgi:hypothetical protein
MMHIIGGDGLNWTLIIQLFMVFTIITMEGQFSISPYYMWTNYATYKTRLSYNIICTKGIDSNDFSKVM